MRSSRLTALVILAGAIAGGLLLQATESPPAATGRSVVVQAGVAIPAANPAGTLTSTWYCAAGSATEGGYADHVLLLANPTDETRQATVTVLPGTFAPPPPEAAEAAGGETTTTPTTAAPATTTSTTAVPPPPEPLVVELPAQSRVDVPLRELVDAKLAGATVEVDGGEVAVEHQITGRDGGRATAPCSTTAAREWSFPWGVTTRGTRELLVFMNPFPDDATVDIRLSTNEDTREPGRLQNLVVRGRSVLGVFIEQDGRRAQVSAHVRVASGRLIVDRIMTFDGTEPTREGITLGLGAPSPAETWIFPDGRVGVGVTEQIVVFNPTDEVAEVEVEARLDDPATNGVPEPFELSIQPGGFSLVDLNEPEAEASPDAPKRIPDDVAHSLIVRSLNGVGITAERVITSSEPRGNLGIAATLGSPVAAPTWVFPGGGVTDERDEFLTLFNASADDIVRFSITALADGQTIAVQDLQNIEIAPGARRSIHLTDHVDNRESLPLVVTADGPIVVERGLYRVQGRGISLSMGIPLAVDIFIPDPLAG